MKGLREQSYILGISLGMNCSAILVNSNGEIETGYEEERFTGNKRESSFPINSVMECLSHAQRGSVIHIGFSHWFDNWIQPDVYRYYLDMRVILEREGFILGAEVRDLDHHFIHNLSNIPFLKNYNETEPVNCLVIDGFGNQANCISIYKYSSYKDYFRHEPSSQEKIYGYLHSLGLFYESVVKYIGLEPKGDEFKILGYESKVLDILSEEKFLDLEKKISEIALLHKQQLTARSLNESQNSTGLIDEVELDKCTVYWETVLNYHFSTLENEVDRRIIVGYVGQCVLERIVLDLIDSFKLRGTDLLLSGGVFLNVKLNNKILNYCSKNVNITPVAGDQGGSVGVSEYLCRKIFKRNMKINSLCIGKRGLKLLDSNNIAAIVDLICKGAIVNIVQGDMEFAPRALCNTSTICLPTVSNVREINRANNRDEFMPMAPVMLKRNLDHFFEQSEYNRCQDSIEHMIITLRYRTPYSETYSGVMHNSPEKDYYTGRPQIVEENTVIGEILSKVEEELGIKCLINTSFNVHKRPIVYSELDAKSNYEFQTQHSSNFYLFLGSEN